MAITTIDEENGIVTVDDAGSVKTFPLASPEAFAAASRAWLRCGWDTKYVYSFSWLGRPIIQLPEDLIRVQEVIFDVKPKVIVETGVAHGGGVIFYASLLMAMGGGRVIGVDIEIRDHNRRAIENHRLSSMITLVEGSSIDPATVSGVRALISEDEGVMVVLDSNHSSDHVLAELEAYAPLVSRGSYVVVCDGIMQQVAGAPRTGEDWAWNNPISAVRDFLTHHPEFELVAPAFPFNEGQVTERVTYWPSGYLRRIG